jgi:hypothetical protein
MIRKGVKSSGAAMGWSETFLQTLKNNDVRFITYVPDNALTPRSRFKKALGTGRGGAIDA